MHLRTEIWLPAPCDEVFGFFSRAENLQALTPEWLHFRILTPLPIEMRRGTLIDYRIRIHGLPMTWQSEISAWDPPHVFVDKQRRGPYRRWVHTHQFVEARTGTLVQDAVDFAVPGGFLVEPFVARDLRRIFRHRHLRLGAQFPGGDTGEPAIEIE
jgi:ligand-binding SRPBCC domain-containing protein